MLFNDNPARIANPGTFPFSTKVDAVYTVGHDFVGPAMADLLSETKSLSCDIETYGLGLAQRRLKSVSFANDRHAVVLDPRDPYQAEIIQRSFRYLDEIIFYNSPFDVPNLYLNGLIALEDLRKITDPLFWSRIANPGERVRKSLTEACDRYLKTGKGGELERAFKALGLNKKDGFYNFDLDRPIYLQGAASDPLLTHRLAPVVRQAAYDKLTRNHPFPKQGVNGQEAWDLVDREQMINRYITLPRTCKGFRVDFEFLDRYQEVNAAEMAEAERALEEANIAPGNTNDLARVLMEHNEIPPDYPLTEKTRKPSMTAENILRLGSPLAAQFVRHRQIEKIGKDYIQKTVDFADDNGRVHPNVNLLAATTGRASMGDPPFHQFSGPARGAVLADEGDALTSVDLSQGEPITIANPAQDMGVLIPYETGSNGLYVALGVQSGRLPKGITKAEVEASKPLKLVYGQLKMALLAQLYGQGLPLLSAKLRLDIGPYGPPTDWEIEARGYDSDLMYPKYREAKLLRQSVFDAMPRTEEYIQKLKGIARQHKMMMTISGRVLDIPMSKRHGKWMVEAHKGVNYFCQGGQYDLMADAQIEIIKAGLADAIYLMMHDEFVTSTSASRDIQKILQTPSERFKFWSRRTPIIRTDLKDLGERWADA
jgi:DNA polymerase-1